MSYNQRQGLLHMHDVALYKIAYIANQIRCITTSSEW